MTVEKLSNAIDAATDAVYKRMAWSSVSLEDRVALAELFFQFMQAQDELLRKELAALPEEIEPAISALKAVTKAAKDRAEKIKKTSEVIQSGADALTFIGQILQLP